MSEPKENSEKKELYKELQALDEEIKKLNSHLENVDEQLSDLNSNKLILNKFTELNVGDELRIPLSSGVYIKAELKDNQKVLVNVGADIAVEKSPKDVTEILDSQAAELSAYREKLIVQMKKFIARIETIQKEFE